MSAPVSSANDTPIELPDSAAGDRLLLQNVPELRLLHPTQPFPLKTTTHVYQPPQLEGQAVAAKVDVVITHFADKTQIIVTDISKPGTIFHISRDNGKNPTAHIGSGSDFIYSVDLLFGAETTELLTTARFLAQTLNQQKSILLTLGFKDPELSLSPVGARNLVTFIKNQF